MEKIEEIDVTKEMMKTTNVLERYVLLKCKYWGLTHMIRPCFDLLMDLIKNYIDKQIKDLKNDYDEARKNENI